MLLLVVCGTICDCEDHEMIAERGERHLDVLRRYLPRLGGFAARRAP